MAYGNNMNAGSPTRGEGLLEGFLARERAKMANRLIPDGLRAGRILDIGCGTTPHFLLNSGFAVRHGIDPSLETEAHAEIVLRRLDIAHRCKLDYQEGFFDAVTMLAVIEHFERGRLVDVLSEVYRVLKPGGRLVLTTPCPWTDRFLSLMATLGLVSKEEINDHKASYGRAELADSLQKAGFHKGKICSGFFKLFLNTWAYAEK